MWHGYRATARNRVVSIFVLLMFLGAIPEQVQANRPPRGYKGESYDDDIGEADNLIGRMPEKVANVKAQLDAVPKEHGARTPTSNPTNSNPLSSTAGETSRLAELDAYWARVSRAVKEGNFDLYASTCHKDGVLVTGVKQQCYPLSKALARWKQDFVDAKAGKTKTSVVFRFRQRLGDETTAHESGIFLYTATDADGKNIRKDYIHFEALLLKRDGWKIMMEYQKSKATVEEWNGLR